MQKKLHNPKSHAPAVYIPCWLIQVPLKSLSHGAKLLYGRLSQWANEKGDVFRSVVNLSIEIGVGYRSIEDYIKELKECGLIDTYRNEQGGINHFVFYDHPWMYEQIKEQLVYKLDKIPPTESCGTPPQNPVVINKKEIKEIKNKNTPNGVSDLNAFLLNKNDMLSDNPHNISEQLIEEWLMTRKKKKAPVTKTAWDRTNKVMSRLAQSGLSPCDCFERMVASGWQGMEFKYFEQELGKSGLKYPTAQERAVNEVAIRERELKAQKEKQQEIEGAKNFNFILAEVRSTLGFQEAKKKDLEEMTKLGMTEKQYYTHVLENIDKRC